MENRRVQGSTAGIVIAVAAGILQAAGMAFLPMAVLQSLFLPVLAVRYGTICAVLSEMAAIGSVGYVWGPEAAAVFLLMTLIPGALGMWIAQRRMDMPKRIRCLAATQAACGMLALALIRLRAGMDVADFLAGKMADVIVGNGGQIVLYAGGMLGWFSSDAMMRIAQYGGETAEIAARLSEDMRMLLPANLMASSVLTGMAAAWWPIHVLARHGLADAGEYIPVEKWWIPAGHVIGLGAGTILLLFLYGMGVEEAGVLAQTAFALSMLTMSIQGAAGLSEWLKKRDVRPGRRIFWLAVTAVLAAGILQMIGLWKCISGPKGVMRTISAQLRGDDDSDDDNDERGD